MSSNKKTIQIVVDDGTYQKYKSQDIKVRKLILSLCRDTISKNLQT